MVPVIDIQREGRRFLTASGKSVTSEAAEAAGQSLQKQDSSTGLSDKGLDEARLDQIVKLVVKRGDITSVISGRLPSSF